MKRLFSLPEIKMLTNADDPNEETLGDCIEICLGILRVALMYEGHDVNLFGWTGVKDVLTGLEHSLLVFNASAYPSGTRNRKANNSRSKGKSYTYEECLDVPITTVPKCKSPVLGNTEPPISARMFHARRESDHEADRGDDVRRCRFNAPDLDDAKRRKVTLGIQY